MIELDAMGTGKVVVVGHRGAAGHAPENTVASFEKAGALGAHAFECDLQITADGQVVVIHDAMVDRVTNGRGRVDQYTLADLRRLDAGSWFDQEYAGQKIPTLSEAVAASQRIGLDLVLEIKGEPEPSPVLVERTVSAVLESGWADHTAIISFHHPCLLWVREITDLIATGILYGHGTPDPVAEARRFQANSIRPHQARVSAQLAEEAHAAGLCLHAWTVNDGSRAVELAQMGVDSIGTDYPDRIGAALRGIGRLA
ncbi:MAG: glycerophosphodiester phosphodiesterase [Anaerolineae bacterium]|nr:glycerophosphodiester phosphodiesterase [Anaerolineae bacterium]